MGIGLAVPQAAIQGMRSLWVTPTVTGPLGLYVYGNSVTCNWAGAYGNHTRGEGGDKPGWYELRRGYEDVLGRIEERWTLRLK